MLVLTFKKGQKVIVETASGRLVMSVNEIKGDKIRIGFDAPSTIGIYREEIYGEVMAENKRAAQLQPSQLPAGPKDRLPS